MRIADYFPFIILLAIFGAYFVPAFLLEKRRREKVKEAAAKMGFSYSESDGTPPEHDRYSALNLYTLGRGKRAFNIITGTSRAGGVRLFDYQYTSGHGKNSHTHKQTVAHFNSGRAKLPAFILCPESFVSKLSQIFGAADIDFTSHPGFSKSYLLRGKDEKAIRTLFTSSILSYFEANSGWTVEGQDGDLLVYRYSKRAKPEDLQQFLNDAAAVASMFLR